jgi:hypothetical protein
MQSSRNCDLTLCRNGKEPGIRVESPDRVIRAQRDRLRDGTLNRRSGLLPIARRDESDQ